MSEHEIRKFAPGPGDDALILIQNNLEGLPRRDFTCLNLGRGALGDLRNPQAQGLEAGAFYVDYYPADVDVKPGDMRREQWFVAADYGNKVNQRMILFHNFIGQENHLEPEDTWRAILGWTVSQIHKLEAENISTVSLTSLLSRATLL